LRKATDRTATPSGCSSMLEDTSTPALVLVGHHHVGIGIVRSLGRLGVPVYCVDGNRCCPAFFSRYCRGKFLFDLHTTRSEDAVRFLVDVGRKIGRKALLIPTSDIGTLFVADQAERLAEHFIFARQDAAMVRSLCSKKDMYFLAKRCGIDAPETSFPQSRADVIRYLETAQFPILLKPIHLGVAGQTALPWRMMLVHSERELLEQYGRIENPSSPNVMLQEYVPGGDEATWTFNGY